MDKVSGTFTLLFENPFWIGVFESECGKNYEVARVVFGPEPTDVQLYEFILKNFWGIILKITLLIPQNLKFIKTHFMNAISYRILC